ncbi:MAG: hypothetical protein ACR2KV_17635 [Solirubrobacteraceae bacterium]
MAVLAVLVGPASALADSSPLATGRPNLVAAQAISATQVLACFDEVLATPINLTDARFYLQGYPEATKTGGAGGLMLSNATSAGGGRCVVALYTGPGDARDFSRLVVLAGAVNAFVPGSGGSPNVQDAVALLGSANAGATTGPDLTSFRIDRSTGMVSFVFDQSVSTAAGATLASAFHLVDGSAGLTAPPAQIQCTLGPPAAPQFTLGPANTVNVNFAVPTCTLLGAFPGPPDLAAVRSAVGVTVDEGAVTDAAAAALVNPVGSLGVTPSTTPTGPTIPPATPIPTLPTPTTPAVTRPTTRTCKRVVTLHLLTTVSRNLRSATATVNGKKLVVSKALTVTVNFGKYAGTKSLVVKIKGKLKNGRTVTRTSTYKNKC